MVILPNLTNLTDFIFWETELLLCVVLIHQKMGVISAGRWMAQVFLNYFLEKQHCALIPFLTSLLRLRQLT
jgi:hypothetical protein